MRENQSQGMTWEGNNKQTNGWWENKNKEWVSWLLKKSKKGQNRKKHWVVGEIDEKHVGLVKVDRKLVSI